MNINQPPVNPGQTVPYTNTLKGRGSIFQAPSPAVRRNRLTKRKANRHHKNDNQPCKIIYSAIHRLD